MIKCINLVIKQYFIHTLFFYDFYLLNPDSNRYFLITYYYSETKWEFIRSDWPKKFTENFNEQIVFIDNKPQVKQSGLEKLRENQLWLQILDSSGNRVYGFLEPKEHKDYYSNSELLTLANQNNSSNGTVYFNTIKNNKNDYIYIIYFPLNISKVNMFLMEVNL